jgi:hypothetical protein
VNVIDAIKRSYQRSIQDCEMMVFWLSYTTSFYKVMKKYLTTLDEKKAEVIFQHLNGEDLREDEAPIACFFRELGVTVFDIYSIVLTTLFTVRRNFISI